MRLNAGTRKFILKALLCVVTVGVVAPLANARDLQVLPVNIFGDGDSANGIEDDRQASLGGRREGVGTIKCDGKIRGTAMVIDTREFAPGLKGAVLVSAAHVLYDLDKKRQFKRCEFHFLALGELSRYQAKIDLRQLRMGKYDPHQATNGPEFGEGDWVFMYVPRPWKGFDPAEALVPKAFSFANRESFQQSGGELRLIAYGADTGLIGVSRHCQVIESRSGDLGGGKWKGQLLDDCDSATGSSGGGIIAVVQGRQFLVGIRNGSHWSEQAFPSDKYPQGPPDGANWDKETNTNFARAFDSELLSELKLFTRSLASNQALF